MENRKLIQHGLSSLTMALPMKWIKERGLEKGDTVHIDVQGSKLIVSTKEAMKIGKRVVEVTELDRTSMLLYVQSLYRFGYDEIEVIFNKQTATHYRLDKDVTISSVMHYIVGRLVGVEIIEQGKNVVLIKYLTKEHEEDFRIVLRRVFSLIRETAHSLLEGIKISDFNAVAAIDDKHDNITKFVSYALRLLNKYGYPDVKKTCYYYHIIASLDKIVDILKYNSRDILKYKKKFSKDTLEVWKHINNSIDLYCDFFYKFSMKKVDELSYNRDSTKNLLRERMENIPGEELVYLTSMKQIMEIILDLTDFRMGMEN